MGVKLNIGCGPVQPDGWINIDNSYRARLVARAPWLDAALVGLSVLPKTDFKPGLRAVNLTQPLPWPSNSAEAIYAGEVLEHFTQEDGRGLLAECVRILAPGGVLRMRVPDNAWFWRSYLKEFDAMRERPRTEWTADHARWIGMFFREICTRPNRFGSAGHYHKWMYDEVSLTVEFERLGLRDVARMPFRQSRIADVDRVEVREDLIVEGVKP